MSKKEATRQHILNTAFSLASREGLDSLTIGQLAKASGMSKSGLFSHFNSRENLQIAVLDYAGELFVERVIQPARLQSSESIEQKLRLLLTNWLAWNRSFQGSCMFLDAWTEHGDKEQSVQLRLKAVTKRWLDYLYRQLEQGKRQGEFVVTLDSWQCVYQLYGVYLSSHLFLSMELETDDHQRFWQGVDTLFDQWRM
ncbi:TetR/AcrR family transcriptional regulator [Photobacterium sp. ZSDE20]|uniref:TetR/AcrR family transcriptional regulator n=1 Tax=Photobacterium pectinilyticum TaxID=2906793 RepID=A0ABT1N6J3_9GAMM|nr:TetR/AcrR family transcriptional regulator [Photobacterium sp. ZSDE20]MCQ1060360.1 TetR/AcrR family transcriptional regulator [Photobacterium sp. ZSDE20]MDD1826892.1 TetR/AcrR family transcriptional regulator [Photobacterium sp. ZSDE20]